MNYKVAKTMLILCIVYLVGFYILKFAFPELLLQVISSQALVNFGEALKVWSGFSHIIRILTSFITYYLFVCASTGKFKRTWLEMVYIVIGTAICKLFVEFLPELFTHTSISVMFILALLCKGKLLNATITFVIHGYLTQFLLSIRGFETVLMFMNDVSGFLINVEVDVWMILLALIFYFKEKRENGRMGTTIC